MKEELHDLLSELKKKSRSLWVFSRPDGKVWKDLKKSWYSTLKRAGIEDFRFHDLRHEAVSRFFEKGLSMPEVAAISGHRDPRMLMRYAHPTAEDIAEKLR